jgi:outer membrane protein TolC
MRPFIVVALLTLPWLDAAAQRDSLHLSALHEAAARTDRRAAQLPLLARQSALRTRTLDTELLPSVAGFASGQYVSDVPNIGGVPMVPYQQYDAYLTVRQRLFDPTRGVRRDLEDAQLNEAEARLRSSLWQQRQAVNDAFFTVLALDAERSTLLAALTDLEAQRRLVGTRVAAGAGLASEAALLDAELLRRRQSLDAIDADRQATLNVLASLTGMPIAADAGFKLPELTAAASSMRDSVTLARRRPEYEQFEGTRETIAARARSASRSNLPRVSAFGRSGYGRPGINPLARDFQSYWIAGLQLEWTPAIWGATGRDHEVQRLQAEIVARDEEQFTAQLERTVQRDLAAIERLERTLGSDDAIIALHEQVLAESRLRLSEGSITASEFVDRETDLLSARTARALHRVRLAEARARFLTTLGLEIR